VHFGIAVFGGEMALTCFDGAFCFCSLAGLAVMIVDLLDVLGVLDEAPPPAEVLALLLTALVQFVFIDMNSVFNI
jgi:hypothetical protein